MTVCSSIALLVVLVNAICHAEACERTESGVIFGDALKGTSFRMFVHEICIFSLVHDICIYSRAREILWGLVESKPLFYLFHI